MEWFEYETGYAWCESAAYKYQTLPMVAEFVNCITNLPLIVLPLVNVMLLKDYILKINWLIALPQLLLAFNGIASTYYHATLNLFDRLLCDFWLYLGTPYLHAAFHLLSSIAAYNAFVMFSILDIKRRKDSHHYSFNLNYFPCRSVFALPYIQLCDKRF
ncbi:unnamed protein product [Anisakis simplex]|uniref:Alkaline ceramidase n=1 Tax=Anisakis simplex TaxID=6269 RepID=A0A0M3K3F8_ANISI|nr:unnamed protein product [Anisakis simplex]